MNKDWNVGCEECEEMENWCNECWFDLSKAEREAIKRRRDELCPVDLACDWDEPKHD